MALAKTSSFHPSLGGAEGLQLAECTGLFWGQRLGETEAWCAEQLR